MGHIRAIQTMHRNHAEENEKDKEKEGPEGEVSPTSNTKKKVYGAC